ncbi:conserved hypothetical protein [Xanthomonas citri pv. fuscans]|nr:conserved hypothetical protein [Xanthomonas citri pv. fuscans]
MSNDRFVELAKRLAARTAELDAKHVEKPHLRLVHLKAHASMDAVTRRSHYKLIRHFRRRWGFPMQIIIDQATFGLNGIEQLDDDALTCLHRDLERAENCMQEGISFEDAGLIRPRYE